jgi:REP-associated tyrosine transposase
MTYQINMPRQSRINIPDSLHHVMARGINGQNIFYDKKDFDHFLNRLEDLFINSGNACFAWSLMNNHFHLLIKSGDEPLSSLMHKLLTGHAVYFNRRHKRFGHLFQNRFKSILCQEDAYFLQLVRYIHLNPLRTGVVKTIKALNQYEYTGHAYLLGKLTNNWQDVQYPLQWFGSQKHRSKQKYLNFVEEGIGEGKREDLTGGGLLRTAGGWQGLKELRKKGQSTLGDERMLGDSTFVEQILKHTRHTSHHPQSLTEKYSLEQLVEDICDHLKVNPREVKSASKQRGLKRAKSMICYIAVRRLKVKGIEVADYLNITKSSVSKLVSGFQPDEDFDLFTEEKHMLL